MKHRIAIWAGVGILVAGCWALYFAMASKENPIPPIVNTLARITCPIAIAGAHFPISVYWVVAVNAATYALVGLIVETLRQRLHQAT
ncbi:MAG TPA: hypothetical protein VNS88_01615 [Nitrospiraceae bacterium]|nr:hypothetical protein [Nitrospiraceae bacterium]